MPLLPAKLVAMALLAPADVLGARVGGWRAAGGLCRCTQNTDCVSRDGTTPNTSAFALCVVAARTVCRPPGRLMELERLASCLRKLESAVRRAEKLGEKRFPAAQDVFLLRSPSSPTLMM
jgi:hypothetical protein